VSGGAVVESNLVLRTPPVWDRLTRASFRVRQQYRYAYPSPIHDLRQRLMMLPPEEHGGQRLLQRDLQVDGADEMRMLSQIDRFGNVIHHVSSPTVREAVEFTAEFTVERFSAADPVRVPVDDDLVAQYAARTALTAPDARIRDEARALSAEIHATPAAELAAEVLPKGTGSLDVAGVRQWAAAQCGGLWSARSITYQYGATGVQTPAAMALHLGRGVCQDYAHIAIAMLRELGVPVRYVSGHLLGEGAPHAWIEALLPDPDVPNALRAVAYDPTHQVAPGLNYITVAIGRDYADVAPTSGTFQGITGHFSARKNAWIVELA
jgi:transglutaminase-like putative cysteine protease